MLCFVGSCSSAWVEELAAAAAAVAAVGFVEASRTSRSLPPGSWES
jgi:hypothetical protein